MKLVTYSCKGQVALGALSGETVVDLRRAYAAALTHGGDADELAVADLRVPGDLVGLLRGGPASLAAARRALWFVLEHLPAKWAADLSSPLANVDLLAPSCDRARLSAWD
jgi:hypothetical protein